MRYFKNNQMNNNRIDQCLNDIQKYEQWGKLLEGQSWTHFFNSNSAMSYSIIHNGLKYAKAQMKLAVLYDDKHTDTEKEERLKEIETDIHHLEELAKNHLKYWGLLTP